MNQTVISPEAPGLEETECRGAGKTEMVIIYDTNIVIWFDTSGCSCKYQDDSLVCF